MGEHNNSNPPGQPLGNTQLADQLLARLSTNPPGAEEAEVAPRATASVHPGARKAIIPGIKSPTRQKDQVGGNKNHGGKPPRTNLRKDNPMPEDNKTTTAAVPPAPSPNPPGAPADLSALFGNPQFQQMALTFMAQHQQKAPEPLSPEVQVIAGQLNYVGNEVKRLNDRIEKNDKPLNFIMRTASTAAIYGVVGIGLGTCVYGVWTAWLKPS